MNHSAAVNTSLNNASDSSKTVPPKAEGVALFAFSVLISIFVVVGNFVTILLVVVNKRLRKQSLFLVINMAFADLMLGAVTLPIYIYILGASYKFWTARYLFKSSFNIFYIAADTMFQYASLISAAFISCERFYAIYWPLKHRTLPMRTYCIPVIFIVWTLAGVVSTVLTVLLFLSYVKSSFYVAIPFCLSLTVIICVCNIGIWRKFQRGSVASQQQNRTTQNKRLTKTLLFVSVLALLCWLPLIVFNFLIYLIGVPLPKQIYYMVNVLNYSNSLVNPVVYALRIPEFRQALGLCCIRRGTVMNTERIERRNMAAVLTPETPLRTLRADPSHRQLAFEQEVIIMETRL